MKIRVGFVSNSSSSSFCAWGIHIDGIHHEKDYNLIESIKKEFEDTQIEIIHEYECDRLYIGMPYEVLDDHETGQQFKDKTKLIINKALNKSRYKDLHPLPGFKFYNEEIHH